MKINSLMTVVIFVIGIFIGQYFGLSNIVDQCNKGDYFHINGEVYYGCYPLLTKRSS